MVKKTTVSNAGTASLKHLRRWPGDRFFGQSCAHARIEGAIAHARIDGCGKKNTLSGGALLCRRRSRVAQCQAGV